jgi:tRNA threonylcarbamoyl adenosine modification protein (Sua5/YciO/YrdC/YwlC family)
MWDLGETNGTVALRMPQDDIALALLSEVGPMAVTSANLTGQPPATTATDAASQLGAAVSVYLDGGPTTSTEVSTILDCTGDEFVVLRAGAITEEQLRAALEPAEPAETPEPADDADAIELPADPAAPSTDDTDSTLPGDPHER